MTRVWGALAALALLGATACSPAQTARPAPPAHSVTPTPVPLATAIKQAAKLGPSGMATHVDLSLGLKVRQGDELARLVASGRTVTPEEYVMRFGPDPIRVKAAVEVLTSNGLKATWRPGSALIAAGGPAPAVAAMFAIDIEDYQLPSGATFYASLDTPKLAPVLAAVITSVNGLDSYRHERTYAVRPGGLTPTDVLAFYNLKPLRDAGLDGAGITVVLPEIDDLPNLTDLNKFAAEFGLPPYDPLLTLKRDTSWGTPEKPQGETTLDLEIIHQVAPAAKMVVYFSAPDFAHADRAFDQMVSDHLGSVISESLGACESDTPSGHRDQYASIQNRSAAQGMSHFVASGDGGAYTCGVAAAPATSFPATLPNVTAVGGTTVFESVQGVYFKEVAWGAPLAEGGSGGGASQFYAVPDYQKVVSQAAGHALRQVPDVAANADPSTGFHIVFGGHEGQAGGTSAAAPLWAATVALIDQDLKRKGLRETGFANPAIYWMGANASRLPARPFHDVTGGNNLAFDAMPGWDFATGWGSMDGAALDAAWITYIKGGGA
ncbi:MAG TPA: S53 family peptidase [Candidatus Nitrosopolaris sp.]|nr:S53 family peptidase [Candidatus Nitrosopolaris sp.]